MMPLCILAVNIFYAPALFMRVVRRMLSTTNMMPAIFTILCSFASVSCDLCLPKNVSAPPDTKPDKPDDLDDCISTHTIIITSIISRMLMPIYFNTSMTDYTMTRTILSRQSFPNIMYFYYKSFGIQRTYPLCRHYIFIITYFIQICNTRFSGISINNLADFCVKLKKYGINSKKALAIFSIL